MKKILKVLIILVIILVIIFGIAVLILKNWYNKMLKPVNSISNNQTVEIEILPKTTTKDIANMLEERKIINSALSFKIYLKLNNINKLQAGKYEFENGKEDVSAVAEKISSGNVKDETVKITFVEGKTITDYARIISEKTNNSEEDVFNLLKDEEYIDSLIKEYWFITEDIKQNDIYYPLEGYLKPDTYTFENKEVSVKYIFSYILNYTEKELENYKTEIENSSLSVHQILTLASVAEQEGYSYEDRCGIVGVFFNRIKAGMSLGSDVTTYYAFGVDMGESNLTKEQINTYNPYNTRGPNMKGKIPIGPICSPSESAIKAVLNPTESDNYYFVSDKNGKTYFTKTYAEHQKIIQKLKDEGLWFEYE